jgi:ubiquitin C-terminal hydrolase
MTSDNIIKLIKINIDVKSNEQEINYADILVKCQKTLSFQIYKLFNELKQTTETTIKPVKFNIIFRLKNRNFKQFEQNDSFECLSYILDTIENETLTTVKISYKNISSIELELIEKMKDYSDIDKCLMDNVYENIHELFYVKQRMDKIMTKFTPIYLLFSNITSSVIECPDCHFKSYNIDVNNIISLNIPINRIKLTDEQINKIREKISSLPTDNRNIFLQQKQKIINDELYKNRITLNECLDDYIKIEKLEEDNKWLCSSCNHKVLGLKYTYIWNSSCYLIIHLKRFVYEGFTMNKINNLIDYPLKLDIEKYISNRNKINKTYELYAVCNHIGSLNGGHYFSFIKKHDKWYLCDDDDITEIDESNIISNHAYILFYKIIEN